METMLSNSIALNGCAAQPAVEPPHPPNAVHSHRYTLINFVPMQIYEQLNPFRKFANAYFAFVGCLQAVPAISVTNGLPVTFAPLFFVLGVDALAKLYEDWQRRRSDALTNAQPTYVLDGATRRFETRRWDQLRVGDIVAVRNREIFPADLLLLAATDHAQQGALSAHCWVSTKSLDGETDTKLREAPKLAVARLAATADLPSALLGLRGELRHERPNGNCNDFAGSLALAAAGDGGGVDAASVTETNMLLRGCQLRNTAEVYALCVNTGAHCKAQYVQTKADVAAGAGLAASAEKVGAMTGRVNRDILGICAMLGGLSLLGIILHAATCRELDAEGRSLWYLGAAAAAGADGGEAASVCENSGKLLGSYFLLSYTFIPVSLYVSINLVHTATALLMGQDLAMYDRALDQPCEVRTMSLCDELGRISHVLSDKTGTLTANHMRLRRLAIGGTLYGGGGGGDASADDGARDAPAAAAAAFDGLGPPSGAESASAALVAARAPSTSHLPVLPAAISSHFGCREMTSAYVRYDEPPWARGHQSLYATLDDCSAANSARREDARLLMLHLAANHSVLYEHVDERAELSAASPDELALVACAEQFGFEFAARDLASGCVLVRDKAQGAAAAPHAVEILAVFPYVSSRKRMTTVVRLPQHLCPPGAPPTGGVYAFTKGADSVVLERLADAASSVAAARANAPAAVAALRATLGAWADDALRTLVFAMRPLPDPEFDAWQARYAQALDDPRERAAQKAGRPNALDALQDEVESALLLQGGSAVEDELQDGVPDTLRDLSAAGVKVWMLTGDKVGTAKNIAAACSLLPPAFPADATDADGSARPLGEKGGGKRADRCHGGAESGGGEGGGVLELTTETVPGLEAVPATDIAQAIAAAAAHAALPPPRKGEAARAPPPLFAELEAKHEPLAVLSREIGRAAQQEREENGGGGFNVASGARSPRASRDPSETAGWLGLGVGATLLRRGVSVCRHAGSHGPLHLIVDEKAIDWLLAVRPVDFATIALRARAVVACRCRQEQKAQMVELVKAHGNSARVLAIGDGANDVAMIKAAHVGVGIAGKEGMQAVQNADFAIGQFRFLRRLMLVHGRANGRRMALLVCYMFYKNVLDRFAQYVYTGEAAWTAVKYYSEVATQLFNVIYTSLPIIAVAVTDSDVPRAVAEALPVLYRKGVRQEVYTHGLFWSWICEALFVSGLLYYASRQTFGDAPFKRGLGAISVQSLGIICQSTIVTICTLRLALEVHAWQLLSALVFVGSLLAWAVSMLFFTSVRFEFWNEWWGFVWEVVFSPPYWLFTIWAIALGLLPKLCREIYGWLSPDSVRQTRLLHAQSKRRSNANADHRGAAHADTRSAPLARATLERRTLLHARMQATTCNTSSHGDTEAGRSIAPRGSSTLTSSNDRGFAFSSADARTAEVVAGIVTSTVSRNSLGSAS